MKTGPEQRFTVAVLLVTFLLVVLLLCVNTLFASRWRLNKNGIWVRQGSPVSVPPEVQQQQFLLNEARLAMKVLKQQNIDLTNGPCLGPIFQGWVADIVHVPRSEEDLRAENQCSPTADGPSQRILEIDSNGMPVAVR